MENEQAQEQLGQITHEFASRIQGLKIALTITMVALKKFGDALDKEIDDVFEKHGKRQKDGSVMLKADKAIGLRKKLQVVSSINETIDIVPNGHIVTLVSQYDAFIGNILRTYYCMYTDKILSSDKTIPFSELSSFSSISDAITHIIEKEVENFLRKSHVEQFRSLEELLGTKLTANLPSWKEFVEVTERRNLFAHCDGRVSKQYLDNCKKHNASTDGCTLHKKINVTQKYYDKASDVIFEIGVKLAQVFWRRTIKNVDGKADLCLINVLYDALNRRSYHAVKMLSTFCTEHIKDYHDDNLKLTVIVNCAIGHKLSGDLDGCYALLEKVDWSSRSYDFRLAHAVLTDDIDGAVEFMKKIGPSGQITKSDYLEWPLFESIRGDQKFKKAFKQIFKEELTLPEVRKLIEEHAVPMTGDEESENPDLKEQSTKAPPLPEPPPTPTATSRAPKKQTLPKKQASGTKKQ